MTSKQMRENPLFLRNSFEGVGKWGIPLIRRQPLIDGEIRLIAASNTKTHDTEKNRQCGVHFAIDDYRFSAIYRNPEKSFKKYSQYAFLLSTDDSTYADMQPWRQLESIAHKHWCAAYWQSRGIIVYPMVSWSTPESYPFCFDAIERHSIVAVGMIGCKERNKLPFLRGYNAMLEKIEPDAIICVGKAFPEMRENLIEVEYNEPRKAVR
jgi:hypothetical protein